GKANFMQPFPYVTGVDVAPTGNAFSLKLNQVDSNNISVESATPVQPVGFSPNGGVENAPVVFAGFGIVSAEPKFDDYAGLDARGKVVLIFDGTPDNDNPRNAYLSFDVRSKA